MTLKFYDPTEKINQAVKAGLTACGMKIEEYAIDNVPVDSGQLKGSINYKVSGNSVTVGSNLEYAIYVEYGTGIYAEEGKGRKTGWAYYSEKLKKKIWTRGNKPKPYLRPAFDKVKADINKIFFKEFDRILK